MPVSKNLSMRPSMVYMIFEMVLNGVKFWRKWKDSGMGRNWEALSSRFRQ